MRDLWWLWLWLLLWTALYAAVSARLIYWQRRLIATLKVAALADEGGGT